MTQAIQCPYNVPYRRYPFLFGSPSVANAFAQFNLDPTGNIALYQHQAEFDTSLLLTLPQWDGAISTPVSFGFNGGSPVADFEVVFPPAGTLQQLMAALAASIAANSTLLVNYDGNLSMRLTQPAPGIGGVTDVITWSSVLSSGDIGDVTGPVHPSGMSINGQYAPLPSELPALSGNGGFAIDTVGFNAAELVGLTLTIPRYTATGPNPYINTLVSFVAAAGPPDPTVAYVVLGGGETAAATAALFAAALTQLGFVISNLVGESFTVAQPLYGPGGNVLMTPGGAATTPEFILFNASPVSIPNVFGPMQLGQGINRFLLPGGGPYGGNVVPLRWGMNYGMVPATPPESIE